MTGTAPRRPVRTYQRNGREMYADTHRPVDERLGTHVLLWVVDDPQAWAAAVEAEGDARAKAWPRKNRHIGEYRRAQAYESAARIRETGPKRSWHAHYHDAASAAAAAASLYRAGPNPGVRYEVAEITGYGACEHCQQPVVHADGQWRHHAGRYPADCGDPPPHNPEPEPLAPGEWEINTGRGHMTCGYCTQFVTWPDAVLGYTTLTGYHLLGIELATGNLVVLAEGHGLGGGVRYLPHHCPSIPDEVRAQYAPQTATT